jgi:rRNA biogenesis protein RRP5
LRRADNKVEAYGMFLRVEDADVSGLCHKSEISDKKSKNVFKALQGFREGDRVKAVITGVDKEKGRVNFSIKPSLFGDVEAEGSDDEENGDEDEAMDGDDDDDEDVEEEDEDDEDDEDDDDEEEGSGDELDFEDGDEEEDEESEDEDVEVSLHFSGK